MPSNSSFLSTTFLLPLPISGMNSLCVYCLLRPQDSPMERTWRAWRIPGPKTWIILEAHSWDKRSQNLQSRPSRMRPVKANVSTAHIRAGRRKGRNKVENSKTIKSWKKKKGIKQDKPVKSLSKLRCLTVVLLDTPDDVDDLVQGRDPIFLTWQWDRHTNFATCH